MLVVTFLLKFVCAKFPPKLFAWSEMPPLGSILVVVGACRKFFLSIERLRRINCLLFVLKQDSLSFMQPMISNCSCIVYEYDALRCATALQHVFAAQQTLIRLLIFLQAIQKNLFTFWKKLFTVTCSHHRKHQVSQLWKLDLDSVNVWNFWWQFVDLYTSV